MKLIQCYLDLSNPKQPRMSIPKVYQNIICSTYYETKGLVLNFMGIVIYTSERHTLN